MIPTIWKKWLGIPHPCENPKSIFIGLIGGVGDLIAAAPSVAALKKKYPEAKIEFGVGDGIFFNTIKNDPNIDRFEMPFFYNVWKKRARRKVYREKYREHDMVLLLDNGTRDWWKPKKHLIDIYAEKCSVTLDRRRPVMYLDDYDNEEAVKKLSELGISSTDNLLVLSPETRSKQKMKEWPYDRFLALIQKINQNHNFKIITFVSKDNPHDYNGTIPLKGFPLRPSAAIIRGATFYLGLDNGLTHIASCFDVKIISIHIGYPVESCGPLSPLATTIAHKPFDPPESISVEEVYETFQNMI
jgi:ADP-heptose:LPS heptosyltransferase|tara:strand:+ start:211 stop:1110 length:900 start_codon:yes stop_codon:yes gene_type:complete